MSGPAYHGRTHLPTGTDPLELAPYAYLSTGGVVETVPVPGGGASKYLLDFNPLIQTEFTTNAPQVFTLEARAVSGAAYFNGGTVNSVAINTGGRYKFTRTLFSGFGVPSDEAVSLSLETGSNFTTGAFQIGNSDRVIDQYQYVTTLLDVAGTTGAIVVSVQNNTGGAIIVTSTLLVEMLEARSRGTIL